MPQVATAYHNALAARNTSASNSSIDGTVVEQHLSLLDGTTANRTVFGVSGNVALLGLHRVAYSWLLQCYRSYTFLGRRPVPDKTDFL